MRKAILLLLAAGVFATATMAQQPRQAQPQVRKQAQAFTATGTVHSFDAQQINMYTAGNQPWVVKITERTSVLMKGEGTEEMLRPGAAVRFYAKLSKRGVVLEPIGEITVMTPREGFEPTIEAAPEGEDGEGEQGGEVKKQLPGAAPPAGAAREQKEGAQKEAPKDEVQGQGRPQVSTPFDGINLAEGAQDDGDEPNGRRSSRARRGGANAQEGERFFVVGQLVTARRGKLVINAGEQRIKGELAEDAKVTVDFTTHALAKKGDAIEVKGYYYDQGEAMANSIEITITPPDEEEETEKKRPGRANRRERVEREKEEPQEEGAPGFGPR